MRFCIACGILPPEVGGPASVIPALASELRQAGHRVTIVTYTEDPGPIGGVPVVSVSRTGTPLLRYLRFARELRKLLRATDVLLATDAFSVGVPCRLALVAQRARFVLRLGGEWRWEQAVASGRASVPLRTFWERPGGIRGFLERLQYLWILRRASLVITPSRWLGDLLARSFPRLRTPFVAVPNLAVAAARNGSRPRPPGRLRLLYVGRFERVKNVVMLARILRALHEEGRRVECTFVGDGSTLPECKETLAGIPEIQFLGTLSRQRLTKVYADHDVLLLPSLSDICPNSVLEALACGVPCLITSEHGLPRPAPGTRELDPQDEDSWKDAVVELMDPRAYTKLRASAKPLSTEGQRTLSEVISSP